MITQRKLLLYSKDNNPLSLLHLLDNQKIIILFLN